MISKRASLSLALGLLAAAAIAATPGSARAQFIGPLTSTEVGTTVPSNGDVNPYGVAIVPTTIGNLKAGHILVSNFNDVGNAQGTGTTIVDIDPNNPATPASVFATVTLGRGMRCPGGVGLTTALSVLKSGWVIVGSLPTTDGTIFTASPGCLIVLNAKGQTVETFAGGDINGPWDMTALDQGGVATLFVSNVLNGVLTTLPPSNDPEPVFPVVNKGTVARLTLIVPPQGFGMPRLLASTIIGSGFSEQGSLAAVVVGPTGVGLGKDGTLYVADSAANRIAAIPDATTRFSTAFAGEDVSSNGLLNTPLGLAIAPNGDILTVNANDGNMVETTPAGAQVASNPTNYASNIDDGAGALFGLAVQQVSATKTIVYFVDDIQNALFVLK
ncbi:MAG TPA: hypothetical protein VMA09_05450 [Candidatus Binataceae bacterium]|nr:hypothetical protein [Candidatus Binataceae bacterium]